MQNAPNFKGTEKHEVVLFCHRNTLKVKERTDRSQTCDFLVSQIIAAWRTYCDISYKDNSSETDDIDLKSTDSLLSIFIDIVWLQLRSI